MKKYIQTLITLFIILILVACGTSNGNTEDNNENPIGNENIDNEDLILDDNANNDRGNVENELNDDLENLDTDTDLITETGIYIGQADPHTIEIETREGPLAFQLTIEARDDVELLIEGEEVIYKYTEDGDNRTIRSIEMNES